MESVGIIALAVTAIIQQLIVNRQSKQITRLANSLSLALAAQKTINEMFLKEIVGK